MGGKKAAERVMKSIIKFIEKKLGLKVNAEKSRIAKPTDIKYLGFGFYYEKKVRNTIIDLMKNLLKSSKKT